MNKFLRALIIFVAMAMIGAVCLMCFASAQEAPSSATSPAGVTFQISGSVRNGKVLLPGVAVTAANTLTGKKLSVVTSTNGTFQFLGLPRGRYVVRVEFMGFATVTQEVVLNPENPVGKVDAELILASRQKEQQENAAMETARRGFQSLAMNSTLSALAGENGIGGAMNGNGNNGAGNSGDVSALPLNGAGADSPTESVSISGAQGRTQDFGAGSEQDLEDRVQEFRERMQREGGGNLQSPGQSSQAGQGGQGGPGGGGPGGGPGGPGGGPIMIGRFGGKGKFNVNQPHGFLYFQDDNSALDARPYSLTGIPTDRADYNQARFGANIGGPLNIPKLFNGGNKWFFFAGWNGSRGSTPYDFYSIVPTLAERSGNFSTATYNNGSPVQIFNPKTGQQYQFNGVLNAIDPAQLSPAAQSLLQFIPLPNIATTTSGQNFHNVTSGASTSDSVSLRLVHNFGSSAGPFPNIQIGPGGGAPGGGGGNRRHNQNNINFGLNWSRSSTDTIGIFPSLNGGNSTQGLNAGAGWVYGKGKLTNHLRFNYNHNHVSVTNLYSGIEDVAGNAGITGISTDPFDFGLPGLSFTSFGGLSDPAPRRELDQTYTISDTIAWNRGKHNWRFGGDYRRILQSFRSARNANGSFVFTGFATADYAGGPQAVANTGYDFADFLLGLPQQTSLQSGTDSYDFRANAYDVYVQDDWRVRANITLNLGLRYEYNSPYTEAHNRIVNLDVGPNFGFADPVQPGQSGVAFGSYPQSLVQPDRNNFAPRLGLAWRPLKQTVVRLGYGINYNLAQYGTFIQNFAFQPPFAVTQTNSVTNPATSDLTLANGFPGTSSETTNNYAIDPNYRLGYVQVWNFDVQRQLPHGFLLNAGYNGAKGTRLDVERAIITSNAQPFIYESSAADSILHSLSVRVRKRMSSGVGFSGSYVFSKSIDDASSIGLGGVVVAQDAFDISADRSLSSFDQRHKFTGTWMYDLPFGENHRLASKGVLSHVLNAWQWSGSVTVGSGFYFTPNVRGGSIDISRGVSGSQRPNYVPGQSIALSNPTSLEWFNTAAFCVPSISTGCVNPAGSAFGDAGRFIIEGPGQFSLNMALNKTIQIRESRALELRIQANNIFNIVQFTGLNTTVNSLAFGEVTSAANMRRINLIARFRF